MAADDKDFSTPDTIEAWRCIGCGRLEAPANCVGICQDRKVELVGAWDYAEAVLALDDARERIAALESALARWTRVTPREGTWQASFLALQDHARALLERRAGARK